MNTLLIPELRELIQEKNEQEMRDFLERLHPAQAAELIEGLKPDELSWVLDICHDDKEALIFEYLPEDVQYDLAVGAGRPQLAKLVTALSPDDRAEFVRQIPPKIVDEILPLMAQAERNDIKRLLSFEPGTVGSRMTTEYASVPLNLTCAEALAKVRQEAPDKETIYTIYIIDADRHLKGVVGLKELLLGRPDTLLSKIMRTEIVTVRADEPAAKAAELTARYDLLAVPIVDDGGRLLGIITVDDLIDVMQQEATQDMLSMGAVEPGALDKPYFDNPIGLVVRKRVGWLMLLFVAEMFTSTVMQHYDEALAKVVFLAIFIPLLLSTGGNAGSQTVSTIIRSLALKEIHPGMWPQILMREGMTGLILGVLLGTVGFGRSLMMEPGNYQLALTIACTILVICTWANGVAAMVPLFAQRTGVDPAVLSAPLIATLVDATGLVLYFEIATLFIVKLSQTAAHVPENIANKVMEIVEGLPREQLGALAEKLRESAHPTPTHEHEWLFPMIALVVLSFVLFSIGRQKRK